MDTGAGRSSSPSPFMAEGCSYEEATGSGVLVNGNNGAAINVGGGPTANRKLSFSFQSGSPFVRAGLLHPKVNNEENQASDASPGSSTRTHSESSSSPRPGLRMRKTSSSTMSSPRSIRAPIDVEAAISCSAPRAQSHVQGDIRLNTIQLSEMVLSPRQSSSSRNTISHNSYFSGAEQSGAQVALDGDNPSLDGDNHSAIISSSPYKSALSVMMDSPPPSPVAHPPAILRSDSMASNLTVRQGSYSSTSADEPVSGSPTPVATRLPSPVSEIPHKTTNPFPSRPLPSESRPHPPLDTVTIPHTPQRLSPPPPDADLETQPLLSHSPSAPYGSVSMASPTPVAKPDLRKLAPKYISSKLVQKLSQAKKTVREADVVDVGKDAVRAVPAVLLGCLLNILDGVSYGMLIFPTSEPFIGLGGMGVSLFFITAVVSQFTYTLGGSGFAGANGSMMIEVVPFFHIIAQTIAQNIGVDKPMEVIATTLVAYSLSSLLTGLAFLLLGALRLGVVIGFFPRHILVGCIGGVGVFLLQTGIAVSLRIPDDEFAYNWDLLKVLFLDAKNLILWGIPAALAVLLRLITHKWNGQLVFPIYFFIIPVVFYTVVFAARLDLNMLRQEGWIFDIGGSDDKWWEVYRYFDLSLIHWGAIWATVPSQFALLFFNILHPPLNVPALSVSLNEDVNTNKELVGHGYSNLFAGMVGSVPNYLVYVNTLLFYRIGGDTRVAGFLLGLANIALLFVGTGPINYLPICVVGALIFVLGWDLVKEAIWDTRGRVTRMEFITIASIMIAMTVWDFVIGVLFGIVVSCFFFVIQNSQRRSIRSIHTGETAMSTVRRPSSQRAYIKEVSTQTTILWLQGFLFFGTITYVEQAIRNIVEDAYSNPVRFLVLDMSMVAGLDMSSADAFVRVHRLLRDNGITMVFCGFKADSEIGKALSSVDVLGAEGVELFEGFGDAIEWTENCYLRAWFRLQKELVLPYALPGKRDAETVLSPGSVTSVSGSPRRSHLNDVGFRTMANDIPPVDNAQSEPYNTLIKVFSSFGDISSEHLLALIPYLHRMSLPEGHVLWKQGDESDGLYIIESGVLRASYVFSVHAPPVEESMVSGTLAGELSALSELERNATVWVERDAVVWKLSTEEFKKLGKENPALENMFVKMVLKSAKVDQDLFLAALASRQ